MMRNKKTIKFKDGVLSDYDKQVLQLFRTTKLTEIDLALMFGVTPEKIKEVLK